MRLLIGAVVAVAALVGAEAASADITRHATTASYSLTLVVGPSEAMYTPAQVKAKHPAMGEVMVGGSSMMGGGMSMSSTARHLEVHVRSRATGKVVTNVTPAISLTDTSAKTMMTDKLDVMAMEGIGMGTADLHYGNNVTLIAHHVYRVVVRVKAEQATFTFTAD